MQLEVPLLHQLQEPTVQRQKRKLKCFVPEIAKGKEPKIRDIQSNTLICFLNVDKAGEHSSAAIFEESLIAIARI